MKRKGRKVINILDSVTHGELGDFLSSCSLIIYNKAQSTRVVPTSIQEIILSGKDTICWFNLYGFQYGKYIKQVVALNKLDDFLVGLTLETNHRTKAIQLTESFFFTLRAPKMDKANNEIIFEQLFFIVGSDFIWSIQEIPGDHFGHIRKRLKNDIGIVRSRGVDYLLYLLIESIIDDFYRVHEDLSESFSESINLKNVKPSPSFAEKVESDKKKLYLLKKAALSLSDALNQIHMMELVGFRTNYLKELREQIIFLNDEIDINLQHLESNINLIFSLQNHKLNEIMKTLTMFSVIFIPLTLIVGIYGMNFTNMPELQYKNGYFILLGVMLFIGLCIYWVFRKRKWFD